MGFLDFLNTLENTLDGIDVHGKENVNKLNACFFAIDDMRESILSSIKSELKKPDGGEDNGRQADIGTDSSN